MIQNDTSSFQNSAQYLHSRIEDRTDTAIILGSGLSGLADLMTESLCIPYKEIPGFSESTAIGHKSNLLFGKLGQKKVLAMQGRFHFYEGYRMEEICFPIRMMHYFGIKTLIVSNAAGGINPNFRVGDIMLINDHINLLPNPLIGPNLDELGPRFPDMTWAYDVDMLNLARKTARELTIELKEGVYVGSTGPTFETKAEYRYLATIGADATGMSTTPEVIVARHCGMRIFGVSVISNQAYDFSLDSKNDGEDVIKAAQQAGENLSRLIIAMLNA